MNIIQQYLSSNKYQRQQIKHAWIEAEAFANKFDRRRLTVRRAEAKKKWLGFISKITQQEPINEQAEQH